MQCASGIEERIVPVFFFQRALHYLFEFTAEILSCNSKISEFRR